MRGGDGAWEERGVAVFHAGGFAKGAELGDGFVEEDAKGKHVGSLCGRLAHDDLWSGVAGGPGKAAHGVVGKGCGEAKVGDLDDGAAAGEEDVSGLEIAVEDPVAVEVLHAAGDRVEDGDLELVCEVAGV